MTHASRTHDVFERLQELRDRLQTHIDAADEVAAKLKDAEAEAAAETDQILVMFNTLSFLRSLSTRNMSESQRIRHKGLCEQIAKRVGK